jgi:hypothetical protein
MFEVFYCRPPADTTALGATNLACLSPRLASRISPNSRNGILVKPIGY